MLAKIITFSPEIFLVLALPLIAFVNQYRSSKTAKTFYSIVKVLLIFSILSTIIFYNRSPLPHLLQNDTYTTLYKVLLDILSLGIFFLSCKWFLNKNRSSALYYALGISLVLSLNLMISAVDLRILVGGYFAATILQYFLLKLNDDDDCKVGEIHYMAFSFLLFLIMVLSIIWFQEKIGSAEYSKIAAYYAKHKIQMLDVMAFAGILLPILFMLGIAPFHFCRVELSGLSILPVHVLSNLIPTISAYAVIVYLLTEVFSKFKEIYLPFIEIVAILSLLWGAISAIKEENIRRFFSYCHIYSLGFILLGILPFNNNGITSSFVYFTAYLLTIWGIYMVLFAFKSNGEYLQELTDISGVFSQKPYISVLLMVFIVSLAGSPPMLIFLGKLQVMDNLMINGAYGEIIISMVALLLMINAFFRIIRIMFFEAKVKNFDHTERRIYICLFINMLFFLVGILNPALFIEQFELLLKPIMR